MSAPGQITETGGLGKRVRPFVLVFVVFVGATWLHFLLRTQVASFLTRDVNARLAAALINLATPSAKVAAFGDAELGNGQTTVSIATGCDGIDAFLMLVGAVLVFPMPWRKKVKGALLGSALLFVVNLLRIVALWYCLRYWPSFFDTLHLAVGQTVVIVAAVAFFAGWVGLFAGPESGPPRANTSS